jgi:hypothetical protein
MGTRNREEIELSYRPVRLAELIPWNQFLDSLKFKNLGSKATKAGGFLGSLKVKKYRLRNRSLEFDSWAPKNFNKFGIRKLPYTRVVAPNGLLVALF